MHALAIASSEPIYREIEKRFSGELLVSLSSPLLSDSNNSSNGVDTDKETAEIHAALGLSSEQIKASTNKPAMASLSVDGRHLTEDEVAICKSLGIDTSDYLKARSPNQQSVFAALNQQHHANGITEDEAWVCRSLGVSETEFRANRGCN